MLVRLHPRDVSLTAESVLLASDRTGPRRVADLATISGTAQPSMTELVRRLEQSGWVERARDPGDGRAVLVALTDLGAELLASRRRLTTRRIVALVDALPEGDLAHLAAALPAIARIHELEAGPPAGSSAGGDRS